MASAQSLRTDGFPHSLNTMMLSQFCGARTEPYTGHVSGLICKPFKISLKGTRNVNNALNNLPCFRTPDENLTFGWAMQNLIRERAVHENAYENMATMIALGESFHESYAARVMFELARIYVGPEDITPHFKQWKDVIHSMNGAFATSDFSILVEDYIRLDPYNLRADMNEEVSQLSRFPITAKLVASALVALAKVTSGETPQLTVVGSAVLAALAALADWVYDLRTAIYTCDAVHLHSTHPGSAEATQIIFVYREKPGIDLFPERWSGSDISHVQSLTSSNASAALRKLSINAYSYPRSMHVTPFSGRVTWQTLLPLVFGRAYHALDHSCASVLGTWIGCIARFFQALATGEEIENASLVGPDQKASTATYGPGLVRTLTDWLPELRRLQGKMERQLKLSTPAEAQSGILENLKRLKQACGCGICSSEPPEAPSQNSKNGNGLVDGGKVDDPPRPSDWADLKAPEHGYCLTVLAETIVALGLTLSGLAVSSALYPSRAGIQSLYYSQVLRRLAARGLPWQQHFKLIYGDEWAAGDARRLSTAVMLFSGSRPSGNMVEKLVAVSHEGICAYFVELNKAKGLAKAQKDGARLIRVVSGGINIKWKVFERACVGDPLDGRETGLLESEGVWEKVEVAHLDEPLYLQ